MACEATTAGSDCARRGPLRHRVGSAPSRRLGAALLGALIVALAGIPAQALDLAERVPSFTLADADGAQRAPSDWEGRALIINFWAPWCAPCRTEMPELSAASEALAPRGFEVVGIALDTPAAIARFVERTPVSYDVLIVGSRSMDLPQQFSEEIVGLPTTVFTDDAGRLVWGRAAAMTEEEILAAASTIERVNAGALTIEEAREAIDAAMADITAERMLSRPE